MRDQYQVEAQLTDGSWMPCSEKVEGLLPAKGLLKKLKDNMPSSSIRLIKISVVEVLD